MYGFERELVIKFNEIQKIEGYDPQYIALGLLSEFPNEFVKWVIGNSLICYQLSGKGEEYWREFSNYFLENDIKDPIEDLISFLKTSVNNKRLRNMKIRILEKNRRFIDSIDPNHNIYDYWYNYIRPLSSTKKTLLFSVKMYGYWWRIKNNKFDYFPMEVNIPVDSRITKFTRKYSQEDPLLFWRKISDQLNIPPLHIDSIIWNNIL